jgi:hypothetical protein
MRLKKIAATPMNDYRLAPKDQSNRRSHLPGYHPVMKLTIQ